MEEYSRIIIEEYCRTHRSKKSQRLAELVEMSYDLYAEGTDDDAIFLEETIRKEKNEELKEALIDLDGFIFPY